MYAGHRVRVGEVVVSVRSVGHVAGDERETRVLVGYRHRWSA